MSPLIESALRDIESDDLNVVNEGFLTFGEVIAVNRMKNFRSGIIPAANEQILEADEPELIRTAILDWIEGHWGHPAARSLFWVLSKFGDQSLQPYLQRSLERCVQNILPSSDVLGQILVALGNIGEQTIPDGSFSCDERGRNLDCAIAYLRSRTD
jgi:hypothetical protein